MRQEREWYGGEVDDVMTLVEKTDTYERWEPRPAPGGGGSGDITEVVVSSPLTGGGTSGALGIGLGTVPINKGGTNATDAATALSNLGAAAASHPHAAADITSGTIATARLGSGSADSTKFLRGDQSWEVPPASALGAEQSETVSGSWSSNTTYQCFRRDDPREGGGYWMHLRIHISLSGAPTSAALTITLPAVTVDTAELPTLASPGASFCGDGYARDTGATVYPVFCRYVYSSGAVQVLVHNASATYTSGTAVTQAIPITFGSTDELEIHIRLPIT